MAKLADRVKDVLILLDDDRRGKGGSRLCNCFVVRVDIRIDDEAGHAEVRKVFSLAKGNVAGCYVTDGRILRSGRARVLRGRQPIYDGGLATLRRFQDDVKEVRNGMECGIRLGTIDDYEEGDIVECYTLEKFPQQL